MRMSQKRKQLVEIWLELFWGYGGRKGLEDDPSRTAKVLGQCAHAILSPQWLAHKYGL